MATDDYASRFATDILRIVVDGDHQAIYNWTTP